MVVAKATDTFDGIKVNLKKKYGSGRNKHFTKNE